MKLTKGVEIHVLHTDKFKDIGISVRFMAPLALATATSRSLLAMMMCDRCEVYDTKKKMSDVQDMLYGTTLHAQTIGYGKAQVLELRSRVIDPMYVKEKGQLLHDVFAFLHEIIFAPLLQEDTFQEAKSLLKMKMLRMKDDPSQYAISQGLKRSGEGTPLAISALGELDVLEKLTLQDMKDTYASLLQNDKIDIIICGNVEEDEVTKILKKDMPFISRDTSCDSYYALHETQSSREEYEYRDITQSSIFMLWLSNCSICDEHYYALRVACAMFGQYSTSLLFREVREKHSLCYSIQANLISFDGAMGVSTGVEKEDEEKAKQLILEQFQKICDGDFDDSLLTVSKTMIINSLHASKDAMNSLMAHVYQNSILKQDMDIDERVEKIRNVTREDVCAAFKACQYQLAFIVSKESDHEEN